MTKIEAELQAAEQYAGEAGVYWFKRGLAVAAERFRVDAAADAICGAGAAWIPEPLHRMAYEDMARAVVAEFLPHETDK